MRVKDVEWWIEPSILSVKDLVSEYVIMDASSDNTPLIIERLKKEHNLNIIHIIDYDTDIAGVSQRGLEKTTCRWILRWDGDFVMHEDGVSYIRNLINQLDRGRYYSIYWPHILLVGDLFHTSPHGPFHIEHWLNTYTPGMKFIKIPHGFEYLYVPTFTAYRIEIKRPLSFHLTIRPPQQMLLRKYRWEYYTKEIQKPFDEYVRERVLEEYNTTSIDEAAKKYMNDLLRELKPYDKDRYLDYPRLLKEYVYKKFKIVL